MVFLNQPQRARLMGHWFLTMWALTEIKISRATFDCHLCCSLPRDLITATAPSMWEVHPPIFSLEGVNCYDLNQ